MGKVPNREFKSILLLVLVLVLLAAPFLWFSGSASGFVDHYDNISTGSTKQDVEELVLTRGLALLATIRREGSDLYWTQHEDRFNPSKEKLSVKNALDNGFLSQMRWGYPKNTVENYAHAYRETDTVSESVVYFYFGADDRVTLIYLGKAL